MAASLLCCGPCELGDHAAQSRWLALAADLCIHPRAVCQAASTTQQRGDNTPLMNASMPCWLVVYRLCMSSPTHTSGAPPSGAASHVTVAPSILWLKYLQGRSQ